MLLDDINELAGLVPIDEVATVSLDYLNNDPEVQEYTLYLISEEAHKFYLAWHTVLYYYQEDSFNYWDSITALGVNVREYGLFNVLF